MPTTYKIVQADFSHIPWLRMLFLRWSVEFPCDYPTMDDEEYDNFVLAVSRHMQSNPDFGCWVAMKGRRVVGFVAAEISSRMIGKPRVVCTIHWLYVVPKHRNFGVTTALLGRGIEWLKSRNITTVEFGETVSQQGEWARRGFKLFNLRYFATVEECEENAIAHQQVREKANG